MKIDLVDVFVNGALSGNPLAVVHGGKDLSDDQMQALTRWLGFSETTFLLPPTHAGADYRVRIFYPAGELPFAGHPTLGTAFAWLAAGGVPAGPVVVQQCGVGLVPVRVAGDRLAFRAPDLLLSGPLSEEELAPALAAMGLPREAVVEAVWADNGPGWKLLRLASAEAVLAVEPEVRQPLGTNIGLIGPSQEQGVDWEVRTFFTNPLGLLAEDPVTGSLNAGAAQALFAQGLAQGSYVVAQGRKTGADGRVYVSQDELGVWIGGAVRMVAQHAALEI